MGANDYACGKKAKNDHRHEEENVSGIDHAFLNAIKMGHHTEGGDRINEPGARPFREQISNWRPACEDEKQTDHQG